MAERARSNIRKNGWRNISLVEDSAETAPLSGVFDALLLFAAHEISTSPEMLSHLLASLKAEGRVVALEPGSPRHLWADSRTPSSAYL